MCALTYALNCVVAVGNDVSKEIINKLRITIHEEEDCFELSEQYCKPKNVQSDARN